MNVKEIPILTVASKLNIAVNEHNKAVCLWHSDKNPSLSFETKENFCKCFSCGGGGSTIDLVMQAKSLSDIQAIKWLNNEFDSGNEKKQPVSDTQSNIYQYLIMQGLSFDNMPEIEKKYLTDKRGISKETIKKWNISYYSGQKRKDLYKELREKFKESDLLESGVFAISKKTQKAYYNFFDCYFLFPFIDDSGNYFHIQGKSESRKYVNLTGKKVLYPYGYHILNELKSGEIIYLTEGLFDTLTLNNSGLKAIGVLGANQLKEHYKAILKPYNVVFIGDNDKAGLKLENALKELIPKAIIKRLPIEYKDINDYYMGVKQNEN